MDNALRTTQKVNVWKGNVSGGIMNALLREMTHFSELELLGHC